jgi:hypothetical protein
MHFALPGPLHFSAVVLHALTPRPDRCTVLHAVAVTAYLSRCHLFLDTRIMQVLLQLAVLTSALVPTSPLFRLSKAVDCFGCPFFRC